MKQLIGYWWCKRGSYNRLRDKVLANDLLQELISVEKL